MFKAERLLANPFMSHYFSVIFCSIFATCCVGQVTSLRFHFLRIIACDGCCQANSVSSRNSQGPNVRLIDANGASGNAGLLQVRTGNPDAIEFGTVCGMNSVRVCVCVFVWVCMCFLSFPFQFGCQLRNDDMLLQAAADVVCRQLGYDFGSVGTSSCEMYGGSNVCGVAGSPVSMASLNCAGGELDIQDCSYSIPDAGCASHAGDAIVFCGSKGGAGFVEPGALRLLDIDGAPSIDGLGRLEVFDNNAWVPVCYSGFNAAAAAVACKAMGFTGAAVDGVARCRRVGGDDLCGLVAPQISEVACAGQELDLLSCPHVGADEVFCAPEESVVLHCSGVGDAQGRPKKIVVPAVGLNA